MLACWSESSELGAEEDRVQSEVSYDELRRFDLTIGQPQKGYRFSKDPLLLTEFITAQDGHSFCDLGTGCGIIPLIMCRRFPASSAVAVENNRQMAGLAHANILRNSLGDRISVVCSDVLDVRGTFSDSIFDVVCSNPPFRAAGTGKISPHAGRDSARHESTAGLADFLAAAKYLVRPSGRMFFVYLPDRLAEFISCAAHLKLALLRLRMVHSSIGSPAKMFLAELAKGRKGDVTVEPPLIIYESDDRYTEEVTGILG